MKEKLIFSALYFAIGLIGTYLSIQMPHRIPTLSTPIGATLLWPDIVAIIAFSMCLMSLASLRKG